MLSKRRESGGLLHFLADERCLCFSKRGGQRLACVGDAEMIVGAKISKALVRVRELWFSLFERDFAKAAQQGNRGLIGGSRRRKSKWRGLLVFLSGRRVAAQGAKYENQWGRLV